MPWSVGIPIFDEKLGKYVPRAPIKEPKKQAPSIRVSEMTPQPLVKGRDTYMKRKRKGEWRKQNQKPTGVGSQTKTGGRVNNLPDSLSDDDQGLFFSETAAVNTGTTAGNGLGNGVAHRGGQQHRKGQTSFSSSKSATGARISKGKKRKKKRNFWEKPKPRNPPKMLSIRGEPVWF